MGSENREVDVTHKMLIMELFLMLSSLLLHPSLSPLSLSPSLSLSLSFQFAIPFWPEKHAKKLKVKVDGSQSAPQTIDFTRPENCLLLHLDNTVSDALYTHTDTHTHRHTHIDKIPVMFLYGPAGRNHRGREPHGTLGSDPFL